MRGARPLIAAIVAGAALRAAYLASMGLPVYDPWRHLLLLEHLRAGRGFTLFEGQPYIWYAPLWYRLAALFPSGAAAWLAGALSVLSIGLLALWLRASSDPDVRASVPYAAAIAAGFGPLIAYTCHYGPESFALACLLAALVLCASYRGTLAAAGAGLLFGAAVSARLSLAFDVFLFLPFVPLRRPTMRTAALGLGAALPLALHWARNHRVIASFDYVFLWDGLAVRTSDFNPLTTLFLQGHPALAEGLRRLHTTIAPWPEWILDGRGIAWGLLVFVLAGVACTLATRRIELILAAGTALAYFLAGDRTLSSNFFRIYLGVFPAFFAAFGLIAVRLARRPRGAGLAWSVPALVVLCGLRELRPQTMYPLEMVTPPAEIVTADAYMVSCGMYQPESFMFRYPDKRFIGMPLDPSQFKDFHAHYPEYHRVVWHAPTVQSEIGAFLVTEGGFKITADATNGSGLRYGLLEE